MNWISVEERTPKQGERVFVIGFLNTELGGNRLEQSAGVVTWDSAEKSDCPDHCYYWLEYINITHWHPIILP